jgi:hypothetical protein
MCGAWLDRQPSIPECLLEQFPAASLAYLFPEYIERRRLAGKLLSGSIISPAI